MPPFLDIKSLKRLENEISFVIMTVLVIRIVVTLKNCLFYMDKLAEYLIYD